MACAHSKQLQADILALHVKAVHEKLKDKHCDQCDFKTSALGNLKTHVKVVHDKIKNDHCGVSLQIKYQSELDLAQKDCAW